MSWCEGCDRSTLELCSRNMCRYCCKQSHTAGECDKYDGEWPGLVSEGRGGDDD